MAIDKGIQEGLVAEIKHAKAERTLGEVEAYDFRIEARYVAAVKELENVSLPLLDQLEALMDSPLELLMSSTLKGSHGEEDSTLEFQRLKFVSEQVTIPVYYERGGSRAPFVNPVVVAAVSHESSLTVTDNQISRLTIVKEDVPSNGAHDDMFDTTLLDRPEDHQPLGPSEKYLGKRDTYTPKVVGSKSTGPKWHILSAVSKSLSAYRNKMKSPTISSPFVLRTDDRAARRKQKLEEKFNEKEAGQVQQETKLKEKAETEFRKLRQSFCFKARPLPNFYKEIETPKNQMKTPEANLKTFTPRRKTPSSVKKKSSRRLWKYND
ncbi:WVD2-like protein 7 [Tanacetum coccineum]